MTDVRLADPAVVVLGGASGSGKSRWAAERFRVSEIVSSDALRAVVGSGPADLDASVDAFALLDQIVAARLSRSLTTVPTPWRARSFNCSSSSSSSQSGFQAHTASGP